MTRTIRTNVPGQDSIELVAWYQQFEGYYGNCEPKVKAWFVANAQPDWIYLDCGANIGYYSILFGRLSPQGHVHAVEPTETADMLARNLAHNHRNNVTVHRVAVGAGTGQKSDGIFRIWGKDAEKKSYDFSTVDDLVKSLSVDRLDVIKIDVDSYDYEVLLGSPMTLQKFNPWVIVELNHALGRRGHTREEAFGYMRTLGYHQALAVDNENYLFRRDHKFIDGNIVDLGSY